MRAIEAMLVICVRVSLAHNISSTDDARLVKVDYELTIVIYICPGKEASEYTLNLI